MGNESTTPSHPSLGFFGIFRESCKITRRNWKMLVAILLPSFLALSQLEFSLNYIQIPLVKDFVIQLAQHPNMFFISQNLHLVTYRNAFDDIIEIISDKHLTLVLSCVIKLLFSVAIISSSSEGYTAKVIRWKEPLYTSLYMILISFGIICVYIASYGMTNILAVNYSWSYVFSRAISLSIPVCYIYVSPLWMVSIIVSVLEGFGGFKAIRRAAMLLNGKRLQASLLMAPFVIANAFIDSILIIFIYTYDHRKVKDYTKGFSCVLKLFMFVAYTVFYHELKKAYIFSSELLKMRGDDHILIHHHIHGSFLESYKHLL